MAIADTLLADPGFTNANPRDRALARMRECAANAHRDSRVLTGPLATQAEHRVQLFVEAASDLSGESLEAEFARATDAPEPVIWALP